MSEARIWRMANLVALGALVLGAVGTALGAVIDLAGFFRAWLCAFLFCLGLPLGAVTLVLVHDLTDGRWMATARPALNAAIATMPLAVLAGIPAFVGLHDLYSWTRPAPSLGNTFYLNPGFFVFRYALYVLLWNLLAAYALWGPRIGGAPISPGSVLAQRRRLARSRVFGELCRDRLDPVPGTDLLVFGLSDGRRRWLVQHRPRPGPTRCCTEQFRGRTAEPRWR